MGKFIQWGAVTLLGFYAIARLLDVFTASGDAKIAEGWWFVVISALAMALTFDFRVFKFSPLIIAGYMGMMSIVYFMAGDAMVGMSLLLGCAIMVVLVQQFMLGKKKPAESDDLSEEPDGVLENFARATAGDLATAASGGDDKSKDGLASYAPRMPAVNFAGVNGMTGLKAQLLEAIKDHRQSGKNGILLSGDPGNGKTFIAEALAGQMKCGFMPITIGDIESKWSGQTTEQLQAAFNAAKRNGNLVLFFDECDSLLSNRAGLMESHGSAGRDMLNTANAFLTNVVDIRRFKGVIVIAATNFIDNLDAVAIRDGRFDFKIHIPNPDAEARRGLLEKFTSDKKFKVEFEEGVLERLVRRWDGFSVVRIRSIAEKILKRAKERDDHVISLAEAFEALREVQGSMGDEVDEFTPTLKDGKLHFDPEMRKQLVTLAARLENIDEFERMGGSVPKGAIFWGPPGTGKTAVAKSLAKTSGWAFLATTGSDLLADNARGFDKLIKKAADLRPCIVFIDEAEEALGDRSMSQYGSIVVNKILAVTDGTRALRDVLFIAATNHPDKLDAAIIRGGRFSEHFEFKKPEDDTVFIIVKAWMDDKRAGTPFHESFTAEAVAEMLRGLAPSDIKEALQQAVNTGLGRIMAGEGEKTILLEDLHAVI